MSLVRRPTLRWAAVIWSRVTPQRFIQYSTALRSDRSSRSVSMKPRLSFRPAMDDYLRIAGLDAPAAIPADCLRWILPPGGLGLASAAAFFRRRARSIGDSAVVLGFSVIRAV